MKLIGADKILNQTMYAKGVVTAYNLPNTEKPVRQFANNGIIGRVYSYVVSNDGKLFWMFIDSLNFPNGTYYVEHNPNKLNVPNLNNILADIEKEKQEAIRQEKGVLQYNIDKYIPYVIGIFAAALLLPVLNAKRK